MMMMMIDKRKRSPKRVDEDHVLRILRDDNQSIHKIIANSILAVLLIAGCIVSMTKTASSMTVVWDNHHNNSNYWEWSNYSTVFTMMKIIPPWTTTTTTNNNNNNNNNNRKLLEEEQTESSSTTTTHDNNNQKQKQPSSEKLRILYTVTTLAEYDTGDRATSRGNDRLQNLLLPVLKEGVESMVQEFGYHVDVFLVCHYEMKPNRLQIIKDALPSSVKVDYWDSASPLSYIVEDKPEPTVTKINTRSLARQHRIVIKDKLMDYDLFVNFEDDMVIKGDHVQNYLALTQTLYDLRESAPDTIPRNREKQVFGTMTKAQLKRTMPGFMRVEVLLDEDRYGTQRQLGPVPVTDRPQIDPKPCCHISDESSTSATRPASPESDKLFLWETGIVAMGIRKMPESSPPKENNNSNNNAGGGNNDELGWVMLQRGPNVNDRSLAIADYWSGEDGYFDGKDGHPKERRPGAMSFNHINNQGGWMATREQIWEWHTEICPGGFLPPYEAPHYRFDGMDARNVEWWSGGMHLATQRHACNLQRIIPLEPEKFARHLIYHSANNKQRQLQGRRERFVKVNDFLGQLNTVRANAEKRYHVDLL